MIIGQSPSMQLVFETIRKVAGTDANVLILGENGTGKELVARELHKTSHRSSQAFVEVDMGSLHGGIFESELFGHKKGAFTGASSDRQGRFELAEGGTLFLDEIGNLTAAQQARLLRVLQQRIVNRVGSSQPIPVDIRLICATNLPLEALVKQGEFRQDLLYRINTVTIHLPPLRARKGDIQLLAQHFLQLYAKRYDKPCPQLTSSASKRLEQHHWPGNVRELQHSMERLVILADAEVVQASDLQFSPHGSTASALYLDTLNLAEAESLIIRQALAQEGGNISHAASVLGISRAALYRRMEKYGLT
ncbi:MAG: sigma-54 dependent transcriptional regulator [Bacteroidota bacterium]